MKNLTETLGADLKEELKNNPSAWVCVFRASALVMIVMFLTPHSITIVNNPTTGDPDVIIIWNEDSKIVGDTLRVIRSLTPTFTIEEEHYPYPPPLPPTQANRPLPGAQP